MKFWNCRNRNNEPVKGDTKKMNQLINDNHGRQPAAKTPGRDQSSENAFFHTGFPKRIKSVILAASFLLMMMSVSAIGNECFTINGETMEENTNARPFVCFPHDEHNEKAGLDDNCARCHHVFDESGQLMADESSEDSSCAECHLTGDDPNELDLIVRYHKLCRNCHISNNNGPVTCGECHRKPQAEVTH